MVTIPEPVRMFTFKKNRLDDKVEDFVTEIGKDLQSVCEANPKVKAMYLHSITK